MNEVNWRSNYTNLHEFVELKNYTNSHKIRVIKFKNNLISDN